MTENQWRDVLPEELAAVDELARLLEQYQTYLLAGSAYADSVRTQASNASGTARPVLERLLPEGVARIDSALRRPRAQDDRELVLEDVAPALKDLRALLATSKWRKPVPSREMRPDLELAGTTPSGAHRTEVPDAASRGAHASASHPAPAMSRPRFWILVGSALIVGLLLGAFRTELPRSEGMLARLWAMLQPVVAAGSAAILGSLLRQGSLTDFKETLRKRWMALLVSSALLVGTAPSAVDAARDLLASWPSTPAPAAQEANESVSQPSSPAPPPSQEPARNPTPQAAEQSPGMTANPAVSSTAPEQVAAECAKLVERQSLGEELTARERDFLQRRCRS